MNQNLINNEDEMTAGRICRGICDGFLIAILVIITYGLMVLTFFVWYINSYTASKFKASMDPLLRAIWPVEPLSCLCLSLTSSSGVFCGAGELGRETT